MLVAVPNVIHMLEKYQSEYAWNEVIACAQKALRRNCKKDIRAQICGYLGEAYLSKDKRQYAKKAQKYLQLALREKNIPHRLQYLCYLSEAADSTGDFVLRYQSIQEAVAMLKDNQEKLSPFWLMNMHNSLAHAAVDLGYYDECEQEYLAALKCAENVDKMLNTYSAYLLISHYKPYATAEIWKRQQGYARVVEENITPMPLLPPKAHKGKIRVGYLSPDFHRHAMFPIYYGFFSCYDKENFTVIGYQLNGSVDGYTHIIRELADEYYDIHDLPAQQAAQKIREDGIDILVDLAGHSANTGLKVLAYRPAWVQVSGLGSLCTAGIPAVDYYITDEIVDPPGLHDAYFVEKTLYMPSQFSYAGRNAPVSAGTPCRSRGYIQFASFQAYRKLNDEMLLVWKKILEQVPSAKLLLKSVSFSSLSLEEEAKKRLKSLGMPMDRVIFEQGGDEDNYLKRYLDVDIVLDTYPYPGGSTTLDALYMGCPVISLYGERRNTRFGLSILKSVGLEELASTDTDRYIKKAIALAEDQELLDTLHKRLRGMMNESKALSPYHYVKKMESYYQQMIYPQKEEYSLISQAYQALKHGDYVRAEQAYLTAGQTADSLPERLDALSSYLLTSQYTDYDTEEICRRQEEYAKQLAQIKPLPATGICKRHKDKLRIGYLSPDFRNHAMFPIYYGLFACYDREYFHVTGYQLNARTDAFTKEIKKQASDWRMVAGLSVEDIAQLIRNDKIDILVDLAGHSVGSGLPVLAYRPAPVQISGLGSLCTTGLKAVDYFITDEICDPPGLHDAYYKEKLLYMPCQFSYAGRNDVPSSSAAPFRKNGFVQLGCFQEYTKINNETLAVWREILYLLPEAKLLFKSIPFELPDIKKAAYERMAKAGLPMERVTLEAGDENYMQRMLDVDLMLDTYPYTGGRTTLDALYMGVPVVTRYGERRNTRFGYSILHSLGLEELAASNREDYVERVVSLAGNGELLDLLHKNLRQMMYKSAALSPRKYTQALEAHYLRLAANN